MTIRFTASRLLMAAICGGALLSAPMVTAPPAHAACNAGQIPDPVTGICWSQSATNLGISGTGGTCLPGLTAVGRNVLRRRGVLPEET